MIRIKPNKLIAPNYFKHGFQVIKTVSILSNNSNNEYAMNSESIRNDRDVMAKQIVSNNDDVSSFVRFNRDMIRPKPHEFADLLDGNDKHSEFLRLKIELICAEYEYIRCTTGTVPNGITSDRMKQLLSSSLYDTRKLFHKWYITSSQSLRQSLKKIIPKLVNNGNRENDNQLNPNQSAIFDQNGYLNYGLNGNTIVGCIKTKKTRKNIRQRYRLSTELGQHLVIDLNSDYEALFNEKLQRFGLTNVVNLYGNNLKRYLYPYNLHFCNINTSSFTYEKLTKYFGKPVFDIMANVTDKSYLNIFENKQNMIYVTSHANDELTHYDHNAIYIMNPFIELRSNSQRIKQFMENKFANEGIRSARIPLEQYVQLKYSYNVYINQFVNILNDMKMGKHWKTAILNNVPINAIVTEIDIMHEKATKFLEKRQSYVS